jgi:hypothetical protein
MNKVSSWLSLCEQLRFLGYAILGSVAAIEDVSGAGKIKVIAATLLARTLSNLHGAMLLAKAGRVVEVRILVRCCFENQFLIAALLEQGDAFITKMEQADLSGKRALGQFVFDQGGAIGIDPAQLSRFRSWMKTQNGAAFGDPFLKPKQVVKGTTIEAAYAFYAELSADAAHPTMTSLARYASPENYGDGLVFNLEPPVPEGEMERSLYSAFLATIHVCGEVNSLLGANSEAALNELAVQYDALLE